MKSIVGENNRLNNLTKNVPTRIDNIHQDPTAALPSMEWRAAPMVSSAEELQRARSGWPLARSPEWGPRHRRSPAIAIFPARGNRGGASSGRGFDPDQFLVAARALACNGDCGVQGVCIPFFCLFIFSCRDHKRVCRVGDRHWPSLLVWRRWRKILLSWLVGDLLASAGLRSNGWR
jgi:hypothetical protein